MMHRDVLPDMEEAEVGLYTNQQVFGLLVFRKCTSHFLVKSLKQLLRVLAELPQLETQWDGAGMDGPEFLSPWQCILLFLSLCLSLWGKQCLCTSNFLINSTAHVLLFPLSRHGENCEDRSTVWAVQIQPSPECISLLGLRAVRSCWSSSRTCMERGQTVFVCLTDAFLFSFAFIIKNKQQ